jgi:hypothetical protein
MGRVEHPLGLEQERAFTGAVASFTDPDRLGTAGDYAATIDWGDATSATAAKISQPGGPGTVFVVSGSHTYAEEGGPHGGGNYHRRGYPEQRRDRDEHGHG